ADDVVYECREHVLSLMGDETEKTAMREVIPPLLSVLVESKLHENFAQNVNQNESLKRALLRYRESVREISVS
ncbi:hypothetical protein V5070_13510, partial [Moellerella wisconsensis]